MTDFARLLSKRLESALKLLVLDARSEIKKQGHEATGSLIESLDYVIDRIGTDDAKALIIANDYGRPVDAGVAAGRIPFSGTNKGSGSPGVSEYIQGLISWIEVIRPSMSEREKKSFAFAIAHTHKKYGMPSPGSYSFSQNGRRKSWVKFGLEDKQQDFESNLDLLGLMEDHFGALFTQLKRA